MEDIDSAIIGKVNRTSSPPPMDGRKVLAAKGRGKVCERIEKLWNSSTFPMEYKAKDLEIASCEQLNE